MNKNQNLNSKADFSIKDKYLFEISFEVVNKVGGIYTVLTSKISALLKYISRDHYFLVGPYFKEKAQGEFIEKKPPIFLQKIFKELETEEIFCHFGEWLTKDNPNVILFDFSNIKEKISEIKKYLWEKFGVDSLKAPEDFDISLLFGFVVGKFFEKIQNPDFILHFHEWQSGSALLYLHSSGFPTVFTTHSTVLGRTLAGNGIDIYSKDIDVQKEVFNLNITAKHSLEKAIALNADVFTTVSEITAEECEKFLGRRPDIVLPNGLADESFLNFEDLTISHRLLKSRLNEFLFYYFFPYYSFNIKKTLYYFFTGRYEFQNKGIDIFIEALSELNKILKKEKGSKNIIAIFWAPIQNNKGIRPELSNSREIYLDIKDDFEEITQEVEENFLYYLLTQKPLDKNGIFGREFISNLERKIYRLKKEGLPPLTSHLIDEESDPIIQSFKKFNLLNNKDDKVKVVLYPIYLTGHDGLLNMTYREALIAGHLGVFPSFYEPWGYTPLETAALGVCSVTSDISGFGKFIEDNRQNQDGGIFILKRKNSNRQEIIDRLTKILYDFSQFSKRERIENKIMARQLASLANWDRFILNYLKAYELSLKKKM